MLQHRASGKTVSIEARPSDLGIHFKMSVKTAPPTDSSIFIVEALFKVGVENNNCDSFSFVLVVFCILAVFTMPTKTIIYLSGSQEW